MAIATGTRFNHYKIIAQLGAGGMGEVYQARDERLGRDVAIKVLHTELAHDADRLRRFEQEARAVGMLNHPNILTIYEIGNAAAENGGGPFIVAELLKGEELRAQINHGALPPHRAMEYATQIISGLGAAHAKGIVHRDLKPENLFITTDSRVKILDFGLAKLKPSQVGGVDSKAPTQKKITDPGTVMGTVGYMAPEQVRGQEADHRADIFSFGMILYEMLSGKRFIADRADSQISTLDLFLYDLSGGKERRFTFHPATDFNPVWASDGSSIVWASTREGVANLYQKAASGAGEETLLLKSNYPILPTDWSWDGRFIIYSQRDPKTKADIWVLSVSGSSEAKPFRVIGTEANEAAATLSPNGQWIAYSSDESGRYEVYVQSFPSSGGKRQVSTGGGIGPHWRGDGKELFYQAPDGKLMAAPVKGGASFEAGMPVALFEFRTGGNVITPYYDVTSDGQRFLLSTIVETEAAAPLTVWVNWAAGVKK